jgi:hypothetical protein
LKIVVVDENLTAYEEKLKQINLAMDPFIDRRNRILDHLLARFGETFPDDLLKKFENLRGLTTKNQIELEMIQAKIRFLSQILPLGYRRSLGFNYQLPTQDTQNIAGIAHKLILLLNIKNQNSGSFVKPLLQQASINTDEKVNTEWITTTLLLENKEEIKVLRLKNEAAYQQQQVSFFATSYHLIYDLFLHAISKQFFKIICSGTYPDLLYHLIYKSPQSEIETVIFEAIEEKECLEKLDQINARFMLLNESCEGFHLVEHILLRPLEPVNYTLHFFDQKGDLYIKGNNANQVVKLKNLAEDMPFIGTKKENYGIIELEQQSKYQVVLYNDKNEIIGKIQKEFYAIYVAEKEMDTAIQYFQEIVDRQRDLESAYEIIQQSSPATMFPVAFDFSNSVSLIFPKWPARFQNDDFKKLIKDTLEHQIPAHCNFTSYFLDLEEMSIFESVYQKWLDEKQQLHPDLNRLDNLSLQLVQWILSYSS